MVIGPLSFVLRLLPMEYIMLQRQKVYRSLQPTYNGPRDVRMYVPGPIRCLYPMVTCSS